MFVSRSPRIPSIRASSSAALRTHASLAARSGRRQLMLFVPILVALLAANHYREQLFGLDTEIRVATAAGLMVVGWGIARGLGRVVQPLIPRRVDPRAIGASEWVVRLVALVITALASLRIAGLELGTLALGASFTAVVVGLAAQQPSATSSRASCCSPHVPSRWVTACGSPASGWTSRGRSSRTACST